MLICLFLLLRSFFRGGCIMTQQTISARNALFARAMRVTPLAQRQAEAMQQVAEARRLNLEQMRRQFNIIAVGGVREAMGARHRPR